MAAIGTRIDRLFKKAAEEAAKIGVAIKSPLPEDRIFSFDDYPETLKQIERLLTALKQSTEGIIVNGVQSAWTLSNNKNNALVSRIFGDRVGSLSKEQQKRYFSTNGAALDAFLQRKQQGLNLSDRVWQYTTAFKHEIEMGLDLGIRSGRNAAQMSRDLRQYLQYPDKLFRRVRDKHGNLKLSKAAAEFHPGQGVYRSSYKNARRLAVTETNIAYRTSDHLRWQQMDFVVGIEIKLSNNHTLNGVPLTDICDRLAGRYPKDFKFTGWHPHCRCHAISVLKTEDEMAEDTQRILSGEKPTKSSVNTVHDVPDAFKDYIGERADRIMMGGNLPYFIKDNRKRVDRILGLVPEATKSPLEIAKERHAARTTEEAAAIQQAWNERRIQSLQKAAAQGLLPKESVEGLSTLSQEELNDRLAFLQSRAAAHAARSPEDIKRIQDTWNETKKRHALIVKKATTVRDLGFNFGVDLDADLWKQLDEAIKNNDLNALSKLTKAVGADIKQQQLRLQALKDGGILAKLDTYYDGQGFSLTQLEAVQANVLRTFKDKGWIWELENPTSLEQMRKGLVHEVKWMETKGRAKFSTWEIARDAYQKQLNLVEQRIKMLQAKISIASELSTLASSKSAIAKQLVSEFNAIFADKTADLLALQKKAAEVKAKATQLDAARLKRAKKATTTSTTSGGVFTPKSDADTKKDFIAWCKSKGIKITESGVRVDNGFIHLDEYNRGQMQAIYKVLKPESTMEHDQLWNHRVVGTGRWGAAGYIQTGNSFMINKDFRQTGVRGAIDSKAESRLRLHGATADDIKTIKLLDKKISEFSVPIPLRVTRYVDPEALSSIFGETITINHSNPRITCGSILRSRKEMKRDPAFLSASLDEEANVFKNYQVKIEIEVPPNTPMYISNNYVESEVVFRRETPLSFISAKVERVGWSEKIIIRCRMGK